MSKRLQAERQLRQEHEAEIERLNRQQDESAIKQWDRVQALASPSHIPTDTGTVFAVLPGHRVGVSWDSGGQTHPHVSELKKAALKREERNADA